MNNNWFTFLVDEKLKIPNDWIGNHKTTGLPTYKPLWLAEAHLLRWPYRTCSDGHIAPAQKRNCSIACNSLSTRLPVWFPDWQSCPFIKYNCAPHTCPFRLSPKPQTYPSVNMWKTYNELAACLYTHVIVTKLPVYQHKHFLFLFFTAHCKHVATVMPLRTHN